jgi:histone deacetylase 6
VGSVCDAVETLLLPARNVDNGFILCRPPGHHSFDFALCFTDFSQSNTAQGFCLFNNLAVGAAHALVLLQKIYPSTPEKHRVLIFDWDVHHGNGTEEIFYNNPNILYISTHLYGDKRFYPYTGGINRLGPKIVYYYIQNIYKYIYECVLL